MAAITPTPRAGTWLVVLPGIGGMTPRAGTWLRVDSVSIPRRNGWAVGFLKF